MAKALKVLSDKNLVHSDIKPDNICVQLDELTNELLELKIVDFGSSYTFDEKLVVKVDTLEYLPPEILKHI